MDSWVRAYAPNPAPAIGGEVHGQEFQHVAERPLGGDALGETRRAHDDLAPLRQRHRHLALDRVPLDPVVPGAVIQAGVHSEDDLPLRVLRPALALDEFGQVVGLELRHIHIAVLRHDLVKVILRAADRVRLAPLHRLDVFVSAEGEPAFFRLGLGLHRCEVFLLDGRRLLGPGLRRRGEPLVLTEERMLPRGQLQVPRIVRLTIEWAATR